MLDTEDGDSDEDDDARAFELVLGEEGYDRSSGKLRYIAEMTRSDQAKPVRTGDVEREGHNDSIRLSPNKNRSKTSLSAESTLRHLAFRYSSSSSFSTHHLIISLPSVSVRASRLLTTTTSSAFPHTVSQYSALTARGGWLSE